MITCEIDGKEFKNGGVLARYLKQKSKTNNRDSSTVGTFKDYFFRNT